MPSPHPEHARRVAGSYLQPLLDAAAARGVTAAALEQAAGLAAGALAPLPDSLPASLYVQLLELGAQLAQDEHFGLHVGECVKLGTYSVYGLILLSCRDFGMALEQRIPIRLAAQQAGQLDFDNVSLARGIAHRNAGGDRGTVSGGNLEHGFPNANTPRRAGCNV